VNNASSSSKRSQMVSWGTMHVLVVAVVAGLRNLGVARGRGQRAEYVSAKSMLLLAGVRIAETPQPGVFAISTRSHNLVALGLANSKNIPM